MAGIPNNSLLRRELPWLVAEVVLLIVLLNANAPELDAAILMNFRLFCIISMNCSRFKGI